jgi:hypothetical protein
MKFNLSGKSKKYAFGSQNRLAVKIAGQILHMQRRIATMCNRRTAHLSPLQWRCLLVLYCLAFSAYCLWLLLHPLLNSSKNYYE